MSIDERLRVGLSRNGAAVRTGVETELDEVLRRRRTVVRWRLAVSLAAAIAVVLVLLPWAVGGLRTQVPVPAPRPTPSPAENALSGTYLVQADVSGATGRWRVTLSTSGLVTLEPPSSYQGVAPSRLTYSTDNATFQTDIFLDAPGCQRPGAYVGRYTWSRSGSTVTFTRVRDRCTPRRELLAAPWELQP